MIKYLLLSILCTLSLCAYSQKQLTIDAFEENTLDKYDDNTPITEESLNAGVIIQILNGIEKIERKRASNPDNFDEVGLTSEAVTNGKKYTMEKPFVNGNQFQIKLVRGQESKFITIHFTKSDPNPSTKQETDCRIPAVKNCVCETTFDNCFGEDPSRYDEDRIVYIYDFNKDPSKREFYKLTKGSTFPVRVNFNREVLKHTDNIKFKIVNINKFLFDVSIADSVISYDSEPSILFVRMFMGDTTVLGDAISRFSTNSVGALSTESDLINSIQKALECFVKKYISLQSNLLKAYDPCYQFPCCYSIEYLSIANDLAAIKGSVIQLQGKTEKKKEVLAKANQFLADCEKNSKALDEVKKQVEDIEKLKPEEKDKKKVELEALKKKQVELESKAKECSDQAIKDNKVTVTSIANELSEFAAINSVLAGLPNDQQLKTIIVFLNHIITQNQVYSQDYISLDGNKLDITINITSKDSIFNHFGIPLYRNPPIHIQIPILGRPFVSFSSGSFIGLGKYLQNKTYNWVETVGSNNTVDTTGYTLVESGYTLPPVGFAALGNLEWKFTRSFGIGASVGVGLTIETSPRIAYLGGISLFLGDQRQFTITGGLAGMYVNRLTNNFQTITDNQVVYKSKPDIAYYKELKTGLFLSLTYTPFKMTRKN